jgi:polygalacturonase
VAVTSNVQKIKSVKIRPLSCNIPQKIRGNTIIFSLTKPADISVEINGDIFHNLQILANGLETNKPSPTDSNVVYLKAGMHKIDSLYMQSNKSLYLEAGAVLIGKVVCDKVHNVRIYGRGILYHGQRGVEITNSSNISVENLIFINPTHYSIFGGQSTGLKINGIRSFSAKGWADGIDLMSCSDVLIDGVFMRTSDDCIALYGHRWDYYGDCRNVTVQNSTLWADVAHPIMIGTHGNPEPGKSEVLENITFNNIDILNHDEPQINYQGCMAINVSDENMARNICFENIRIEDFERGQLFNLRVTFNKKYAQAPGRGIENILFKNINYTGRNAGISILEGYSADRGIRNIVFENLTINGKEISGKMIKPGFMKLSDFANVYEGLFVGDVQYTSSSGEIVENKK